MRILTTEVITKQFKKNEYIYFSDTTCAKDKNQTDRKTVLSEGNKNSYEYNIKRIKGFQ